MPDDFVPQAGVQLDDFPSSRSGPVPVLDLLPLLVQKLLEGGEIRQTLPGVLGKVPEGTEIDFKMMIRRFAGHAVGRTGF